MANNYYQWQKERLQKEAREWCQIFLKKEKAKEEERPEKNIPEVEENHNKNLSEEQSKS